MPESYGSLEATIPHKEDKPIAIPSAFKAFVDSLGSGKGAGKLIIAQNIGAAKFAAMTGDVSINESGITQIGNSKLATGMYQDGSVTSRKFKPTCGLLDMTGESFGLTTSYVDVPGCKLEITPAVASILKVTAFFRFQCGPEASADSCEGSIKVDSESEIARIAELITSPSNEAVRATVGQVYLIPLTAAAHTIKMRARRSGLSGPTTSIFPGGTSFLYELIAS